MKFIFENLTEWKDTGQIIICIIKEMKQVPRQSVDLFYRAQ